MRGAVLAALLALAAIPAAAQAPAPAGANAPMLRHAPPVVDHLPGVGAQDHRVAMDSDAVPWRSLVRVQTEMGGRCTGFLVAPDRVMTAGHCLFQHRTGAWLPPVAVHVVRGYQLGSFAAHAIVASYRVGPGFDPEHETETGGRDWALLTLDRRIARPEASLGTGEAAGPIMLGGYGQDREERILADPDCRIIGRTADGQGHALLRHDCAATGGTSGAPLLAQAADGVWRAVGIQIAGNARAAGGVAIPLPLP